MLRLLHLALFQSRPSPLHSAPLGALGTGKRSPLYFLSFIEATESGQFVAFLFRYLSLISCVF